MPQNIHNSSTFLWSYPLRQISSSTYRPYPGTNVIIQY